MGIKFANGGYATLASSITSSDTSITLTTGQGARFPSLSGGDYFYATLIDTSNNLEIVKCTARSTDVLTVTRAQESTTARSYSAGDRIELRITAQGIGDATDIDLNLPSQTGNSGKYLTTDGTNASWGTVTAPTPAAVSDQSNSSTGYFDLPAGTQAQRPGSPSTGMLRFNTSNKSIETYYDYSDSNSTDGWSNLSGWTLVALAKPNSAWNTIALNWGTSDQRYVKYRVEIVTNDPNSNASRFWMRVYNAGTELTTGYGYSQDWRSSNDGAAQADSNANWGNGVSTDHIKLTNQNPLDSGYWIAANGEIPVLINVEISAGLPNSRTQNAAVFVGNFSHRCATGTYGETSGAFGGGISVPNTATSTNGQPWYPISGIVIGLHDAYTMTATTGPNAVIAVYGFAGFEERGL